MITPELCAHIQKQKELGITEDVYKRALLELGWTEADIQEAIAAISPAPTSMPEAPVVPVPAIVVAPVAAPIIQPQIMSTPSRATSKKSGWIFAVVILLLLVGGAFYYNKLHPETLAELFSKTPASTTEKNEISFEPTTIVGTGIGLVESALLGGKILVNNIPPNSPADVAGVRVGDELLSVDGNVVATVGIKKAEKLLEGEKGTSVTVEVMRLDENKTYTMTIVRGEIILPPENAFGTGAQLEE